MIRKAWVAMLMLSACGDTGQRELVYPVFFAGQAPAAFAAGAWQVTLDVARVGFGPVYFCATAAASADLCPVAVAEYRDSVEGNALDAAPQPIGEIRGVTGHIHSLMLDYALTWFNTQTSVRATDAAPGGHSAHFEGTATQGATSFAFVADIDVAPTIQGTSALQGVRVNADISHERMRLDVRVDATAWWRAVDFNALAALGASSVVVEPGTRAYNAVAVGMTTQPPVFEWTEQ